MIIQKEFLNKLKDLGLNSYESKLWTALLSRGVSTAGELSDIANVPRSRTYDVLESLEKKGFVLMKIGKPIKYIAVPPEEAVIRVKKNVMESAETQSKILDKIQTSDAITQLTLLYTKGITLVDPTELAGSLKGRDNLYSYLECAFRSAEKSILISTTEEGASRKLRCFKSTLEKAYKKGVKIKVATPINQKNKQTIQEFSKFAEIKNSNGSARFFVIDGTKVVFPLTGDKEIAPSYDTSVWVESPFFAGALESMFNSAWKSLSQEKKK